MCGVCACPGCRVRRIGVTARGGFNCLQAWLVAFVCMRVLACVCAGSMCVYVSVCGSAWFSVEY